MRRVGWIGALWLGCTPVREVEPAAAWPPDPSVRASALTTAAEAGAPARAAVVAPILNAEIAAARAAARRRLGEREAIEGGVFVRIEDPAPDRPALARFHAALRELAAGRDADGKLRIAVYGASGTAADLYTGYLRAYLQLRFGDGGPGFAPIVRMNGWHRHSELVIESSRQWQKTHAVRAGARGDGQLGLMGVAFAARSARAFGRVRAGPRLHAEDLHGELYYWRGPGGGRLRVLRGAVVVAERRTAAASPGPGYLELAPAPGAEAVELRHGGGGELRVFGVVLETSTPGVVLDTLGLDGARASNQLGWDEGLWAEQLRRRGPALVLLSYGTNESSEVELSLAAYRRELAQVLERHARALPEASCVLLGPIDYPAGEPRLTQIVAVQRELAAAAGCGFWDGQAFMGGPGSMATWAAAAPPLARPDLLHLTRRGALRMGEAIGDALLWSFDCARVGGIKVEGATCQVDHGPYTPPP